MEKDELDLSPYLAAIRSRRRAVYAWAVVGIAVAAGITFILKATWKAEAVLLIPMQGSSDPIASLLKSDGDPLEIIKGVLESKANLDFLTDKTKVKRHDLEKMLSIKTKSDQNQVQVDCVDANADLAKKIVSYSLINLDKITSEGNLSQGVHQAKNLESYLAERNAQLKEAEDKLLEFTKKAKTPVDPTNPFNIAYTQKKKDAEYQLKMVQQQISVLLSQGKLIGAKALTLPTGLPGIEDLRQQLVHQEYDLATKQTQLGPDSPDVRSLQAQIEVTKKTILSEISKHLSAASTRVDPALASLTAQEILLEWQNDYLDVLAKASGPEGVEAARLLREVVAQQDTVKFTRERYEQAKLQGAIDTMHWSVLVSPYVDDIATNKRYGLFSFLGALCGILLGCILAIRKGIKPDVKKKSKGSVEVDRNGLTDVSVRMPSTEPIVQ